MERYRQGQWRQPGERFRRAFMGDYIRSSRPCSGYLRRRLWPGQRCVCAMESGSGKWRERQQRKQHPKRNCQPDGGRRDVRTGRQRRAECGPGRRLPIRRGGHRYAQWRRRQRLSGRRRRQRLAAGWHGKRYLPGGQCQRSGERERWCRYRCGAGVGELQFEHDERHWRREPDAHRKLRH